MDSTAYSAGVFAGFRLPRVKNGPTIYNPTARPSMAREYLAQRLRAWRANGKGRGCIGPVTYPNRIRSAETARHFSGWGFYLEDESHAFGLRMRWADDVAGLDHRGWFIDPDGDGETARGFVLTLPRGRGFLAGWALGVGMCGELDSSIYDDETTAALAADSMAENMAENEREYRENLDDETDGEG